METEKIIITKMSTKDLNEVVQIEKNVFPSPWTRYMFENEIKKKEGAFYLVGRIEEVVSYAGMNYFLNEAHLTNLAVSPSYQSRGLGALMLILMIKQAQNLKLDIFWLEVRESNIKARNLYEKFFFEKAGLRKNYYADQHEDAILYYLSFTSQLNLKMFIKDEEEIIKNNFQWELKID